MITTTKYMSHPAREINRNTRVEQTKKEKKEEKRKDTAPKSDLVNQHYIQVQQIN